MSRVLVFKTLGSDAEVFKDTAKKNIINSRIERAVSRGDMLIKIGDAWINIRNVALIIVEE